jgi:hypothetical protein
MSRSAAVTQGSYALIIDTGTNPFINTGSLETDNGTMIIKSQVTGGGNDTINGGTLEFATTSDNNVRFSGNNVSILDLDHASGYSGIVSGFSGQDQIDLGDIRFGADTTLSYTANSSDTGGTLSLSDGSHIANIALFGQYTAASFTSRIDGSGGTIIGDATTLTQQLLPPHATA